MEAILAARLPRELAARQAASTRLKLDYLHAVLVEGRLYSFPWPAAAASVSAIAGACANAAGILEASLGTAGAL